MMKNDFIIFCSLLLIIFQPDLGFSQLNINNVSHEWLTDKENRNVDLNEFRILLPRDGIPPIDNPKFWSKEKGQKVFFKHEPVIAIEINGIAKAYPLSILMFHEIVNDEINNVPISVTFCPLCNSAIVFDRRLNFNNKAYLLDFGVSGMLRKSDMVMWDRQTETWWQQFTGTGLVGYLAGAQLEFIPSQVISVEDFYINYPNGQILSTENGKGISYGQNPYINYDAISNSKPRLFFGEVDSRLPAMERIINIRFGEIERIYPYSEIVKRQVINEHPYGSPIVIFFQQGKVSVLDQQEISESKDIGAVTVFDPTVDGRILEFFKTDEGFSDRETKSIWTITGKAVKGELKGKQLKKIHHGNHFAFAWLAFQPDSEIYGKDD